jgi:pimeloyl-ACP methyl ester carboxylesterase
MGTNAYENLSDSRLEQARSNLIKEELLGSGFPPLDKEKIAQIELPTLFISGEKSPKLFHYLIDGLQQLIPHSERKMIPNASHIMHEDNVHDYNSALFSFLQKHEN